MQIMQLHNIFRTRDKRTTQDSCRNTNSRIKQNHNNVHVL